MCCSQEGSCKSYLYFHSMVRIKFENKKKSVFTRVVLILNLALIANHFRGWGALQQTLKNHPEFHKHFVEVCLPGESWKSKDAFVNSEDEKRIPFDLLSSSEAEICFRNHLNDLQIQHKKKE